MRVQFELEKYDAMEPKPQVFTRAGVHVRILATDVPAIYRYGGKDRKQPIAFVTATSVMTAAADGTFMSPDHESPNDLFMEVPELEWEPSDEEVHAFAVSCDLQYAHAVSAKKFTSTANEALLTGFRFALKREHALEQRIAELERKLAEKEQG